MYHVSLIIGQFLIAAVLVLSTHWRPLPWDAILATVPGAVFAMWAWFTIGLRDLRIHPTTTPRTRLVRTGPYRIVRHPMYSGLLCCTAGLVVAGFSWWRCVLWLVLLGVLIAKSHEEEKSLCERFSEYVIYQSQVGMLFPKLFRSSPAKN